ncbi:hypothetical protein GOBAR_DD23174 [Gossypium barbadense]|nr:hypothetical protein GOBAR_DD23174 [Gossypium barbadense]
MAALVLLRVIVNDHDNLFVAAEAVHSIGISVLIYKLTKEKTCAGFIKTRTGVKPGTEKLQFIPIPMSYKELYQGLFDEHVVAPHYLKPPQPPYPKWYDANAQCEVNVMHEEVLRGVHINAIDEDTIEKGPYINDLNDTATDLKSPFEQDMCLEGSHDFEDDIDRSLSPDLLRMVEQEENKFYLLKRQWRL